MRKLLPLLAVASLALLISHDAAYASMTGPFFDKMAGLKDTFTQTVYSKIAPDAIVLLKNAMMLYFLWLGFTAMRTGDGSKALQSIIKKFIPLMVINFMLHQTGSAPYFYTDILQPAERDVLRYAAAIMQAGSSTSIAANGGDVASYSALATLVESQILQVLRGLAQQVQDNNSVFSLILALGLIIVMLPYLFVWGIWVAFMFEAMFKIVAAGIIAPLLMVAFVFEGTRPFAIAGLRILLGAGLTIIFASGAMGFSMMAVNAELAKFVSMTSDSAQIPSTSSAIANQNATVQQTINAAQEAYNVASQAFLADQKKLSADKAAGASSDVLTADQAAIQADTDAMKAANTTKQQATSQLQNTTVSTVDQTINQPTAVYAFQVFSDQYFYMFVIGFASVLLHLSSKTLASNISGANDGAGPAAAVVAGAKATLGTGMYGASRLAGGAGGFGGGDAGSTMSRLAQQAGIGGLYQHGAVGGLAVGATNLLRGLGGGSAGDGGSSGDDFIPTGGGRGQGSYSTGGSMQPMVQAIQQQTQMMEKMFKAMGGDEAGSGGGGRGVDRTGTHL